MVRLWFYGEFLRGNFLEMFRKRIDHTVTYVYFFVLNGCKFHLTETEDDSNVYYSTYAAQ